MKHPLLPAALLCLGLAGLAACGNEQSPAAKPPQIAATGTILGWIADIEKQGIRRPGYAADDWVELWSRDRFAEFGLQDVELDPIEVQRWEPAHWSLRVWHEGEEDKAIDITSWPVPLSAEAESLEAELVLTADPADTQPGKIAVVELTLLGADQSVMRDQVATWSYDPSGEFEQLHQVWPMSERFQRVMDPETEAGAAAFIGILNFPWETDHYYVPYDGKPRPIPGLYLSRSNGEKLKAFMAAGKTLARIELKRELRTTVSHNVMGTLPGASDEWIVIGSHHDGPWHSAVEDASGVAMVLAQAHYWAQVPQAQRPHNLMFLLNGGHMSGGAGLRHFVSSRSDFVEKQIVTEIHLEHVAREARVEAGELVPTERPEVRWWFTSFIPQLEESVARAICREKLERSLIMPTEGFPAKESKRPPTDAARFHPQAPIVSLLAPPMYLFDPADRLNMIHEESLQPVTRATISIINELRGVTAAGIRAGRYARPRESALPGCDALMSR